MFIYFCLRTQPPWNYEQIKVLFLFFTCFVLSFTRWLTWPPHSPFCSFTLMLSVFFLVFVSLYLDLLGSREHNFGFNVNQQQEMSTPTLDTSLFCELCCTQVDAAAAFTNSSESSTPTAYTGIFLTLFFGTIVQELNLGPYFNHARAVSAESKAGGHGCTDSAGASKCNCYFGSCMCSSAQYKRAGWRWS